jgi:mono/diheme cytochrome c family protein
MDGGLEDTIKTRTYTLTTLQQQSVKLKLQDNMMKKLSIISVFSFAALSIISCDSVQRSPGRNYMPDMGTSRAYETYAGHSNLASKGIQYNNLPVEGTVSRGEELPYHLKNDSLGYALSAGVKNPLPQMTQLEVTEAERLYLVNCAICHGSNLNGNGPLYRDGNGPYAAKPATLVGDPNIEAKTEGTYYHVQTYGKGVMGSYAAQVSRRQRWMIARYIKLKQGSTENPPPAIPQGDTTVSVRK